MFGLTFNQLLALAIAIVIVALVGVFLWDRRRRGVTVAQELAIVRNDPRSTLEQVALKGGDLLDTIRDTVTQAIKDAAGKLPDATLKDAYFDADDFLMDVGRLPPTFEKTVMLDGAMKRGGSNGSVEYWTNAAGNVTKSKPA